MSGFALTNSFDGPRLSFAGETAVADARELHATLRGALRANAAWSIDAGGCTRLDLAVLQILAAARLAFPAARVTATSPGWTEAWQRYGLADPFTAETAVESSPHDQARSSRG